MRMASDADLILFISLFLYVMRYGLFVSGRLTVTRLYDFIRYVADGHCNAYETRIWSLWCEGWSSRITIHTINHASRKTHWFHHLLALWNLRGRALFAFYMILVLTSHLWLSPLLTLTVSTDGCDPRYNITPCRIEPDQVWHEIDTAVDYRSLKMIHKEEREPSLYQYYSDTESGKYYVAFRMLDGQYKWFHPPDLVRQLEKKGKASCVCPLLMGITENVTFINYHDKEEGGDSHQWLMMYRPFVYRNNTMSYRIESSLTYKPESAFYENYRQFMSTSGTLLTQIHYETLYVEYTEIWPQRRLNNEKGEGGDRVSLLLDIVDGRPRQRRVTLTQSDAICFHFCDTTNNQPAVYP